MASTAHEPTTRALGQLIATHAVDIEKRWLKKVTEEIAKRPPVELSHLRDGIPDYLAALAQILSSPMDGQESGVAIWADVARGHGITRVQAGFDIDQLVHEFVVLRREIRTEAIKHHVWSLEAAAVLADLIDAAIIESVRAYVEARDYQVRRVQAEHVGFLTHELRNPLATAMSATSILRETAVPEQTSALEALERSHTRLHRLIDGVLDAQRLEAGEVAALPVDVRERELLERATEAARQVAERKGLKFEMHVVPERVITVDPNLTRSAIQNLVDNAVKYTDEGGVEVATSEDARNWFVHIRDSCPGLSAEELKTIFEPFRRGATRKQGTGLGLTIARRAVEAQGGTIQAESPGLYGCHFWITLPKHRN